MRFAFTEEQEELRAAVRAMLERHATSAQVRAAIDGDAGPTDGAWRLIVEQMELTSLMVPEEQGGAGASFVEVGIVLEELGRSLMPVPYLPTTVAAALLPATWLERIVAGAVVGLALPAGTGARLPDARAVNGGLELHGTIDHVIGGESAELLVVAAVHEGALGLFVVDADSTTIEPRATLDQTRRQAS